LSVGILAYERRQVGREMNFGGDQPGTVRGHRQASTDLRGAGDRLGGRRLVDELLLRPVAGLGAGGDLPGSDQARWGASGHRRLEGQGSGSLVGAEQQPGRAAERQQPGAGDRANHDSAAQADTRIWASSHRW